MEESITSSQQEAQFTTERLAATNKVASELAGLMTENKSIGGIRVGEAFLKAKVAADLIRVASEDHKDEVEVDGARLNAVNAWAELNQLIAGSSEPKKRSDLLDKMRDVIENNTDVTNGIQSITEKTHELISPIKIADMRLKNAVTHSPHQDAYDA